MKFIRFNHISSNTAPCSADTYCTPGLIIAAHDLLDRSPDPSDHEIRLGLSGNLCRCTGYTRVFTAVREAAREMREGKDEA